MSLLHEIDRFEGNTDGYLVLEELERALGQELGELVADEVLLVDHRRRLDASGAPQPVTVCRLNRHHPRVKQLGDWG